LSPAREKSRCNRRFRGFWDWEKRPEIAPAKPKEQATKRPRPEKFPAAALLENGGQAPVVKAVKREPHPGIDAKIESRDGVRTIVFSRSWLNAFVFGVRLAWLSPFPLGVIEGLDLTAFLSVIRTAL